MAETNPLARAVALSGVMDAIDEAGPWYHVSPQQIEVGARIAPGGAPAPGWTTTEALGAEKYLFA